MTKSEIQDAANIDRIRKLRANGHAFECRAFRTNKGTFAIGLRVWHRNDIQRINELAGALEGRFTSLPYAQAYIRQIEAAA